MWSSRLRLVALKSSRAAQNRLRCRAGLELVSLSVLGDQFAILDNGHARNENLVHKRRHLSVGRRHGWKGDSEKKPKTNFSERFLEPAAHGELKEKHSSGIPKLAVRKSKGHQIHGEWINDKEDLLEGMGENEVLPFAEEGSLVDTLSEDISRAKAKRSQINLSPTDGLSILSALDLGNGKDPDYWREEDFDVLTREDRAYFRETYGSNNSLSGLSEEMLDEIRGSGFDWKARKQDAVGDEEATKDDDDQNMEESEPKAGTEEKKMAGVKSKAHEAERETYPFFNESCDKIVSYEGDGSTDLRMQWSESRLYSYHPESKREPLPFYPTNRRNPHPLIVEFYSRWLYVSGLPPALSEAGMAFGKPAKLTVLQEQEIQETVSKFVGVSTDQIYPANETSAFVGFESPDSRAQVLSKMSNGSILTSRPVTLSPYSPSDDENTSAGSFMQGVDPQTVVRLENLPPYRFSRDTLARDLFGKGSELAAVYPLSSENVWFLTPTVTLLRFDSVEQAGSALSSKEVMARLERLGQYQVRLFNARRNLIHDRMEDATNELRKLGHRLVVDGDMPSKDFYISHAGVIMLRNLDRESVTNQSITDFFQLYSDVLMDTKGSIEFVTCIDGLPTDRAYVGFERLGEAEAVIEEHKGRARIGDSIVLMKLVKDRKIPGAPPMRVRPNRSEEEIVSNLHDWEQYVDPEDLKYLEEHGIARIVMDEALRGLRYHNRSFGALDWAMSEEKLEPDKGSGDDYREAVRMYVETLKECLASPENPGVVYEAMHFPGEPIDLSVFETEKQRMKKLLKRREE